jgi:hypothetical protein
MKKIKYICINNNDDSVFVCTSTTALASHLKITTMTLYRLGVNKNSVSKYKHYTIYFDNIIHKSNHKGFNL